MRDFFSLINSNNDIQITFIQKFIPILLVTLILVLVILFKDKIKSNCHTEKNIRYFMALTSFIFLSIYYFLEWTTFGINANNLPLHLCFISSIASIFLCINKNKLIFNFVFYTGILGGLSSLLFPALDLSWRYFRYYQFMIIHGLIIIIPLYFLIIHNYLPKLLDTIKVIIILQLLALLLGVFNQIYNTTYMFVSFTSNSAAQGSILYNLGSGFEYFIRLELLAIVTILTFYYFIRILSYKLLITKD